MHIVLDLQACQSPESGRRGIGRYSLALAKAMAAAPRGHRVTVALNAAMEESVDYVRSQFEALLPAEQIFVWHGLRPTYYADTRNRFRRHASETLRSHALQLLKPDVVHIASLFDGIVDEVVSSISGVDKHATVATLYDLIPLAHRDVYLADPRARGWYMEKVRQLKRADQLLGISRFSCEEAHELLSVPRDRLTDISGAADEIFVRIERPEDFVADLSARYGLDRKFVMYAGGFDPRKNIGVLIRAFAKLPDAAKKEHQLAIVGGAPAPERAALERIVQEVGLSHHDVVFTGYVPDGDLVKLYNLCALYVFPSLQEGFGLPALEAMSCGAVVIGSGTSSLPEVIGFEDALFDPRNEDELASKMQIALTEQTFRRCFLEHAELQCRKFSWAESARRALDGMDLAFDRRDKAQLLRQVGKPRHSKRRTALLPAPDSSLVQAFPGVRIFADGDCSGVKAHLPLSALAEHRQAFDRIVAEVSDDAYGAKVIEAIADGPADLCVRRRTLGNALEELAAMNRRRVVEIVLRQAGYRALWQALDHGLDASTLSQIVPPSALNLIGQAQVVSVDDVHAQETGCWRDGVDSVVTMLLGHDATPQATENDWCRIASAIAANDLPLSGGARWFVDISILALHDAGTGIQRVVRRVLDELVAMPPEGVRVEPVMLGDDGIIRYARSYCQRRYFPEECFPGDEVVDFRVQDVYVGLDLAAHLVPPHVDKFKRLRILGVRQYFVVYDLLPLLRPECFDPDLLPIFRSWYEAVAEIADGVICISRAVADEFETWLHQFRPGRLRPLHVGWFHLGADLDSTDAAGRARNALHPRLEVLGEVPTFLMVGTIEPRKGHAQVLAAFEQLWAKGSELNLLIVGRPGWLVEALVDRLRKHPMQGRKLFWFEDADDELLLACYDRASALLMASEGEGFGLPLIEAAQHGLPLIVRDLPVFREIAGRHAYYFQGHEPEGLAAAVEAWLALQADNAAPSSGEMPRLTWAETTTQLVDAVRGQRWMHRWLPGPIRRFGAYDYRFRSQVGRLVRGRIRADGTAGILMYGPYVPLATGRYSMRLHGCGSGAGWMDVCSGTGAIVHAHQPFDQAIARVGEDGLLSRLDFELVRDVKDLELRVGVAEGSCLEISHIEVHEEPAETPARAGSVETGLFAHARP